ncbi:MAG: efflux RND transporter periplasmic adaptor subunit [Limimaricola sp.]|nr:efflux RND transporter periplasmic adaptor subunit [Limimaricola sp.]
MESVLASARGHGRRRRLIWLALVLVLAAGGAWLWLQRGSGDAASAYVSQPVETGDLTVTVTATGTVQPTNLVDISSELSGTVRSVEVTDNAVVTVGQVLARLDTDKLQATLASSQANLDAAVANVAEADANVAQVTAQFERAKQLLERNISTVEAFQAAQAAQAKALAAAQVARAQVNVARANLAIDQTNLSKATITSPIAGTVLTHTAEVGQIVASSLQAPVLFTIAEDLSKMELNVDIDEADVGQVKVGQPAAFRVEAYPGRSFPAKIAKVLFSPQTVDGVVTYEATLSIDNTDLSLRPGMTATAEITVDHVKDALLVPNAALRFAPPVTETGSGSGGGLLGLLVPRRPAQTPGIPTPAAADGSVTIWLLKDGKPAPVKVIPGATDGTRTAVTGEGLAPGDAVITDMASP